MNAEELERASGGTVRQTKYLKKNPVRQYLIGKYLQTIASLTRETPARTVLDVGCGEGFVIRNLSQQRPDLSLAGLDAEPEVLKIAVFQNPQARFFLADGRRLPVRDARFDLVLCNEVLEHLPDPRRALQELARVSKEHVILSVPREPHYRIANMLIGANWERWGDDADHRQRWTRSQFKIFAQEHFDVLQVRTPFPWLMLLCKKRS